MNRYNNGFLPLVKEFFLMKNIFMYLKNMMFHSWLDQFCHYLVKRHHFTILYLYNFSAATHPQGQKAWALVAQAHVFICLTSLSIHREVILPPRQNAVWICKQLSLLILYQIRYRLVSHLKFIYVILVLIVYFKLTASHSLEKIKTHHSPSSDMSHGYTLYKLTNSMEQANGP